MLCLILPALLRIPIVGTVTKLLTAKHIFTHVVYTLVELLDMDMDPAASRVV